MWPSMLIGIALLVSFHIGFAKSGRMEEYQRRARERRRRSGPGPAGSTGEASRGSSTQNATESTEREVSNSENTRNPAEYSTTASSQQEERKPGPLPESSFVIASSPVDADGSTFPTALQSPSAPINLLEDHLVMSFISHSEAEWRSLTAELEAARAAASEAERKLREGMQPEVWPTDEEINVARARIAYDDRLFYFGIAGTAGSGKSSLVNALRGIANGATGAAPTGITETTQSVATYRDANPTSPFVWCDIPGAGTLSIPGWMYFNEQGLFVFDCILVVWDNRFTETDIAILRNCELHKIPAYVVRSKSDQHIESLVKELKDATQSEQGDDGEEEDGFEDEEFFREKARQMHIEASRASMEANFKESGLAELRGYLVSNSTLRKLVGTRDLPESRRTRRLAKIKGEVIDEDEFLKDLFKVAHMRKLPSRSVMA